MLLNTSKAFLCCSSLKLPGEVVAGAGTAGTGDLTVSWAGGGDGGVACTWAGAGTAGGLVSGTSDAFNNSRAFFSPSDVTFEGAVWAGAGGGAGVAAGLASGAGDAGGVFGEGGAGAGAGAG